MRKFLILHFSISEKLQFQMFLLFFQNLLLRKFLEGAFQKVLLHHFLNKEKTIVNEICQFYFIKDLRLQQKLVRLFLKIR